MVRDRPNRWALVDNGQRNMDGPSARDVARAWGRPIRAVLRVKLA